MENLIWERILNKKLRVTEEYYIKFKSYTEFKKSKSGYATFGAFYTLYLYAFTIGYHSGNRYDNLLNEKLDTFNQIREWGQVNSQSIFKSFLASLLSDSSVRDEIGFNINYDFESDDSFSFVNKLIIIFEEYANEGFRLLDNAIENSDEQFNHFMSFQKFHTEIMNCGN